ncbi:MAG: MotA/TolQ/ExbB proton channel family protein [Planctomycetes bacterium]|nr:MotA/TolQ/ExbB proton channel family protein [Planctomycetota bacterium]
MHRKRAFVVLSVVGLLAFAAGLAWAQEEGETPQVNAVDLPLFTFMFMNGFSNFMQFFALTLASVAMLALTIEHMINIRRDKLIPPELVGEIEALLEDEEYGEALDLCEAERCYLTNVMAAAIPRIGGGFEAVNEAAQGALDQEGAKLLQKVSWLSFCSAIAPLLGLLGTIIGMISAFGEIARLTTSPKPAQLANGISTALYTTAFGLVVAIPATLSFFFFRYRVFKLSLEVSNLVGDLLERFRPQAE